MERTAERSIVQEGAGDRREPEGRKIVICKAFLIVRRPSRGGRSSSARSRAPYSRIGWGATPPHDQSDFTRCAGPVTLEMAAAPLVGQPQQSPTANSATLTSPWC